MDIKLILFATGVLRCCASFPVNAFPLNYNVGETFRYSYVTEMRFNEPEHYLKSKQRPDLGLKISANLDLTAVWSDSTGLLMELKLHDPKLFSVSRTGATRPLKGLAIHPVYFYWNGGQVNEVYTDSRDANLGVNIKKGIISLFQISNENTVRPEIDVSGECSTKYVINNGQVNKVKMNCSTAEMEKQYTHSHPILGVDRFVTQETQYQLEDNVIKTARATDSIISRVTIQWPVSTAVNSRQELKLVGKKTGAKVVTGSSKAAAVQRINTEGRRSLFTGILTSSFAAQQCERSCNNLSDVISKHRSHLLREHAAKPEAAETLLLLVDAFRSAPENDVTAVLKDSANAEIREALIDSATAAGTESCQKALMSFLNFKSDEEIELPERYLLAVAMQRRPRETVLKDLLALYKSKVPNENLQESISESLGAVLYNFVSRPKQSQNKIAQQVQQVLLQALTSCADSSPQCRRVAARTLANAGIPATASQLVKMAEVASDPWVAEEAVRALRRIAPKYITKETRQIMLRIFTQQRRPYDTAVRTRILNEFLRLGPTTEEVKTILYSTVDPTHTEFNMYVQRRLLNNMKTQPDLRKKVNDVIKNIEVFHYNVLAQKGKSLAMTSPFATLNEGDVTYDIYVENARAGNLKRSGIDVVLSNNFSQLDVYKFGIFAAGLESLTGEAAEPGQENQEPTAGISLDLMDVSLRPITFFTGKSGLMSAAWSAPAEPTSALRANFLLHDHTELLHLSNGLVAELDLLSAVSMDISGSMTFSLWNKNAHSLITNSGSFSARMQLRVDTNTFRTGMEVASTAASAINFQSDVDFYDKVKTCLTMGHPPFQHLLNTQRYERIRGLKKGLISRLRRTRLIPGVCYPFPVGNYRMCKILEA